MHLRVYWVIRHGLNASVRGIFPCMITLAWRRRWWVHLVVLCAFGMAVRAGWRWLDKSSGNSEEVFSQIRLGMSKSEVIPVLLRFQASSGRYSFGVTTNGEQFSTFHHDHPSLDDLPAAPDIEYAVLSALDSHGREIEVTLGPGGIVTSKSLTPGVWDFRWDKLTRAIRDIPYRVTHSKYRTTILVVSTALLLLSIVLVGRRAWRSLVHRRTELNTPVPLKSDSCRSPNA